MIFDLSDTPGSEDDDVVIPELSDGTLRKLFSAAKNILTLQPWETLCDSDWFGIREPESGATHIVAVMGANREYMAVQVYLPEEGIRFWNECIYTGEPDLNLIRRHMRMLSCEFISWDEEEMDEIDIERNETYANEDLIVTDLDSFLFRSTLPGCLDWHPDEAEVVKLMDAFRLLPVFLKDFKKLPFSCYEMELEEKLPNIPVYELKKNGDRSKASDWELKIEVFPEAAPEPEILPDELFPARLGAFPVKKGETWEIGSSYMESPVVNDGRPTWMTLTLVASQVSGMAFGPELCPLTQPKENALRKSLLAATKQAGYLPGALHVHSEFAFEVFQNLPGISVHLKDYLPLYQKVSASFLHDLDGPEDENPLNDVSPEAAKQIQELMSRFPSPESISEQEIATMMAELQKIKGGDIILQKSMQLLDGDQPDMSGPNQNLRQITGLSLVEDNEHVEWKPSTHRYIFRIELEHTEPLVWRKLSIAADCTFADLHYAIQSLFDWDGDHCHTFPVKKGRQIMSSIGPDDEHDGRSEYNTPLSEVFKRKGSKIHYVYDFGDKWSHLIKQEAKVPTRIGESGPICLDGENVAPLEDCGGIHGFYKLLDPESGYAEKFDYDEEFLKHIREGKFSPADVKF